MSDFYGAWNYYQWVASVTKIKLPVSLFVYVSRIFDSIKETFQRKTCLGEVMQQDKH